MNQFSVCLSACSWTACNALHQNPSHHHLCVEGREMSLWVIYTCKGGFRTPECGGYRDVHDRLREWHWESPGWCRQRLFIHHTFPCLLLQILAQFLVGPAQFFVSCLRRSQVNLDAFLIHYRCRHRFLKGAHRFHDLLHGDAFPSVAPAKTKGRLEVVCTPTLMSILGQRNIKVCNCSSLKNCVPCYYPLYSLEFLLFSLPAFRVSEGMP